MTSTATRITWGVRHCSITAERPLDTRLAAVLESKPLNDEVPEEAWWHIAESLRHSIPVRRSREGVAIANADVLQLEICQATWSAEAALSHLGAGPSAQVPGGMGPLPVRTTVRNLARMIVSSRVTPLPTLRRAVLDHITALSSLGE